jgi:tRNA-specific 2-thiouridylase
MNWVAGQNPAKNFKCLAKVRYRDLGVDCEVEVLENNKISVKFAKKNRGITPGQSVVLYDGQVCLGGGEII